MRRNIFVCSDAQHEIKVVISEQHKNILLFVSRTNFLLFVSFIARNWLTLCSKNLIIEQHKMLDFLKGQSISCPFCVGVVPVLIQRWIFLSSMK
jgi:hypothetical protein